MLNVPSVLVTLESLGAFFAGRKVRSGNKEAVAATDYFYIIVLFSIYIYSTVNKFYSITIFSLLINAVILLLNCLVLILYIYIHFLSLRHYFLYSNII